MTLKHQAVHDMRDIPEATSTDYISCYDKQNRADSLAGRFLQQSHTLLEKTAPQIDGAGVILEVGAGTGHHFPAVSKEYSVYIMTDDCDEMLRTASAKYRHEIGTGRLRLEKADARSLPYADGSVDQLIATHVLEHLPDPVAVLREWDRVVKPGGVISIVLPCDPGLLWRFGRCLGPRRAATRRGLAYDYIMASEHINSIFNLRILIRYHFTSLTEYWHPFRLPIPDVNLFYICHITKL